MRLRFNTIACPLMLLYIILFVSVIELNKWGGMFFMFGGSLIG
jgi:hypothetical protein